MNNFIERIILGMLLIPILFFTIYSFKGIKKMFSNLNLKSKHNFFNTCNKNLKIVFIVAYVLIGISIFYIAMQQILIFTGWRRVLFPIGTIAILCIVVMIIINIIIKMFFLCHDIKSQLIGSKLLFVLTMLYCFNLYTLYDCTKFISQYSFIILVSLISLFSIMMYILINAILNPYVLSSVTHRDNIYIWYVGTIIIICFINIFYFMNYTLNIAMPNMFQSNNIIRVLTKFETFYYTASTFLGFSCESIVPTNIISQFVCLISRVMTILCLSVFTSIAISTRKNKKA